MNSKQRRQFNRKFKHEVVLFHHKGKQPYWTERLAIINERFDWCERNVGKCGDNWVCRGYDKFIFKDARVATWFTMKFL